MTEPRRTGLALLKEAERLAERKQLHEAAALYQKAMREHAQLRFPALVGLAVVLRRNRQIDAAIRCLEQAAALRPDDTHVRLRRAYLLQLAGRLDDAQTAYDALLARHPNLAVAWAAKAQLLAWKKRLDDALAAADAALRADAASPEGHHVRAEILLQMGRRREGWKALEHRFALPGFAASPQARVLPAWRGEPFEGKTLLITRELGYGDTLMYARYLPQLRALGSSAVLIERPEILELLSHSFPFLDVASEAGPSPAAEMQCSLLSLPHLLDVQDSAHARLGAPYLVAPSDARAKWARRLGPRKRPRIGIVWSSRANRRIDETPFRNRTLPFALLEPLLRLPFEFHSLQKEVLARDREGFLGSPVVDHAASLDNFSDTAALANEMDLVISTDTSVAHLAGGLGLPVWTMLPYASDYRWEQGTSTSWYPTARLFRQTRPAHWDDVVNEVGLALREHFARRG